MRMKYHIDTLLFSFFIGKTLIVESLFQNQKD